MYLVFQSVSLGRMLKPGSAFLLLFPPTSKKEQKGKARMKIQTTCTELTSQPVNQLTS